jgi:SAM-dependent methyltransferase
MEVAKGNVEELDLQGQPRVCVGCRLCGSSESTLLCSAEDIAAQQRFLERFYRSRWSKQNAATATDRVRFTQDYSTGVVVCDDCGLLYRNPRPPAHAVAQAYETDHYDARYLRAEFEAQRAWARTKVLALEPYLAKATRRAKPRVLEIGSFVGGFLFEGRERGWDMLGIDPGQEVATFCRERHLPVFEGTFEEARLPPGSFDAVVVWNTFDQLPDPRPLLEQAVRVLRHGGLLVVRIPNGACYAWAIGVSALLPKQLRRPVHVAMACNNLLTFPYLYGYSADQLERLVEPYGFRALGCHPDVIVSTPPGDLTWWASVEERAVKSLWRAIGIIWPDKRSSRYRSAPWLDCLYERACSVEDGALPQQIGLGVVPVYSPLVLNDTGLNCPGNRWDREGGLL